jgi:hypothetical protein
MRHHRIEACALERALATAQPRGACEPQRQVRERGGLDRGADKHAPEGTDADHDGEPDCKPKARVDGFDLEATTVVRAEDRERLEHLCRYLLRPRPTDACACGPPTKWPSSSGAERLASLVPRPRTHQGPDQLEPIRRARGPPPRDFDFGPVNAAAVRGAHAKAHLRQQRGRKRPSAARAACEAPRSPIMTPA